MRIANFMISLPLLLCVAQGTKPFSYAQAAALDATQATQLLAKAHAINGKCSILAADKSQELRDYVARAELSLAEKASVAVARKAIAEGKANGKASMCDQAANTLVNEVVAAASIAASAVQIEDRTTTALEPQPQPQPQPQPEQHAVAQPEPEEPQEPVVVEVAKPAPVVAQKVTPVIVKPRKAKPVVAKLLPKPVKAGKGLGAYAGVAETYYVALRCGGVKPGKLNQLYKTVLSQHQQALANNRARDVRAMLRSVEARAGSRSCG